jgi:hypothetical protein
MDRHQNKSKKRLPLLFARSAFSSEGYSTPSRGGFPMTNLLKTSIRAMCTLVIVAGLSQTLHAQSKSLYAKIPFGFEFGRVHIESGAYVVDLTDPEFIILRGGSHSYLVQTRADFEQQPATRGRLVFERHGSHYHLTEAWMQGNGEHRTIYVDRRHRGVERAAADSQTVEVALTTAPQSSHGE